MGADYTTKFGVSRRMVNVAWIRLDMGYLGRSIKAHSGPKRYEGTDNRGRPEPYLGIVLFSPTQICSLTTTYYGAPSSCQGVSKVQHFFILEGNVRHDMIKHAPPPPCWCLSVNTGCRHINKYPSLIVAYHWHGLVPQRGSLKRSARAVQLFGRLAVLEAHTLRY